jgi:hypothetical protein
VVTEGSSERVQVETPSRTVTLSWDAREGLVARLLAAYPTTHQVVSKFEGLDTAGAVKLSEPNDMTFVLAVIDVWALEAGEDLLPEGICRLRAALRSDVSS